MSDHPPIGQIMGFFKSEKTLLASFEDATKAKATTIALAEWADRDVTGQADMIGAGQIYHEFLQLPLATQEKIVTAMAQELGVVTPVYAHTKKPGKPTKGRTQLASVLYSRHPEYVKPKGKNKDSLAGKRVSDAIRAYKRSVGLLASATRSNEVSISTFKRVFGVLVGFATSDPEVDQLVIMFGRCGISTETLDQWIVEINTTLEDEAKQEQVSQVAA